MVACSIAKQSFSPHFCLPLHYFHPYGIKEAEFSTGLFPIGVVMSTALKLTHVEVEPETGQQFPPSQMAVSMLPADAQVLEIVGLERLYSLVASSNPSIDGLCAVDEKGSNVGVDIVVRRSANGATRISFREMVSRDARMDIARVLANAESRQKERSAIWKFAEQDTVLAPGMAGKICTGLSLGVIVGCVRIALDTGAIPHDFALYCGSGVRRPYEDPVCSSLPANLCPLDQFGLSHCQMVLERMRENQQTLRREIDKEMRPRQFLGESTAIQLSFSFD